jgi:hypothetical protein
MRERQPRAWELIVSVGRDPLSRKWKRRSRTVRGTKRDARGRRLTSSTTSRVGQSNRLTSPRASRSTAGSSPRATTLPDNAARVPPPSPPQDPALPRRPAAVEAAAAPGCRGASSDRQRAAGHANAMTTLNVYAHVLEESDERAGLSREERARLVCGLGQSIRSQLRPGPGVVTRRARPPAV